MPTYNYDISVPIPSPIYDATTCGVLAGAAYVDFSIVKGMCGAISSLAQPFCCEELLYCSFCDGESVDLFANVSLAGYEMSCYLLELSVNPTECSLITPLPAPACCGNTSISGAPSTDAPSAVAAVAPVTTPVEPKLPEAPTVSAAAALRLSTLGALSMMLLAFFLFV